MKNLHAETLYLQGARDILLRLKSGYDMYLIPSEKCSAKKVADYSASYEYFPVANTNKRRLIGDALQNLLISDRKSLSRFLLGDYGGLHIKSVERNKKGKITKLKIELVNEETK